MIKKYLNQYKDDINQSIDDLKHKDTFYKQIPNLLTFIRLVGALPAGLMYYFGNPYIALGSIAFLWGTDAIDGKLARKFNIQSKLGADMDTIADKIMFLASALPLLTRIPNLIMNFVLEGVISTINVTGRVKGLDTKTVLSGKIKTVSLSLTLIFGYLVQFFGMPSSILNILIWGTTGLQLIAIGDYIIEFNKMNKELKVNNSTNNNEASLKEQEKELVPEISKSLLNDLIKEKEFILSTIEPSKKYTGKKKIRTMIQEKNNSYLK